jgi:hypothetical protein
MIVLDDPHVVNLQGERFDIRMPSSECVLLRVPFSNEDPELLRLSASINTDGVSACGLYVKAVALSGSLLDHQVVRVRPHTRNAAGSNQAGNETMTNFSLQVGNSSWKDFSQAEDVSIDIPDASVGVLRARFVRREEFGHRVEAQSVQLLVGKGERPVVFTITQAKHQALNLEIQHFGELGHRRIGGALGTEGRDASLEQPTLSCRRMKAPRNQERHAVWDIPEAQAPAPLSSISASWQ